MDTVWIQETRLVRTGLVSTFVYRRSSREELRQFTGLSRGVFAAVAMRLTIVVEAKRHAL
ncbi:hypothetical protein YDYSY3_58300 [Paenibacillus chitinolyticus]|nr:hypothetical protein YDYSY3_58300 [Paenibacillus chitinolyticus]